MKKTFQNIIASVLGLALIVVALPLAPQKAHAAISNWQKGVSIESRSAQDFGSATFQQSVKNAQAMGVNYITLIIPYYQSNTGSTDIKATWNTPTDAALTSAVNYVHSLGMHVMLKPHLDTYSGEWRAFINPGDRNTWFTNYGTMLNHVADIGKLTGAEEISIGAELISMSTYTSNADNTQRWQSLIASVRARYSGLLTYSANWGDGDFANEKAHIGFWGSLDYIGISAYFNLYGSNDVNALKGAWDNYKNTQIKPLSDQYGKPVLFTEIGYRSVFNAHQQPWNSSMGGAYDATEQSNDYTALFDYWNNQPFMVGVQLWNWSSDPAAGGVGNIDYTPQGKSQALSVMDTYFNHSVATDPGTTTTSGGTTVNGTFTANGSITPAQPVVNQATTLQSGVTINGTASNTIVDLEIYDATNKQVFQKFYSPESFSANQTKNYSTQWTPTSAGNYYMTVGMFNNDWTKNYYWNTVSNFNVGTTATGTTTNPGGGTNTSFAMTASASPSPASASQPATIHSTFSSKGDLANAIVDIEVYNASNQKVLQQSFVSQNFSATVNKNYDVTWTPTAAGTYTIKGGIFNNDWSKNYYWNDSTASVTVSSSGTTTPPNDPGTGTYTTNIWWPTDGATVQGVQPFKAMVNGLDISQYKMYWQVDGDALNEMVNSTTDGQHKESLVDVSGWNWKGAGPYTLNFVSKNAAGAVITQKSININIQH
jgi:hypothetical protein